MAFYLALGVSNELKMKWYHHPLLRFHPRHLGRYSQSTRGAVIPVTPRVVTNGPLIPVQTWGYFCTREGVRVDNWDSRVGQK